MVKTIMDEQPDELPPLPPKKKRQRRIIGCLSCLEVLPLGPNPIPVIQLIIYGITIVFGMLVAIPIGITLRRFTGSCILYAQVVWDNKTIWPWAETSCDFILYANLGINVIFATFMCLFILIFILPRYDEEEVHGVRHLKTLTKYSRNFVLVGMNPMLTTMHIVIWCTQLSGSIVLSVGFTETCKWLERALIEDDNKMTCEQASRKLDWSEYTIIRDEDENGVQGYGFYAALAIASFASWTLVIFWTLQLVLNFGQICTRCSCDIAEEKVKLKTSALVAARRSRLATPIGTPGGRYSTAPSVSMPPYRPMGLGPAPQTYHMQPPGRYPGQSVSSEA